MQRRSSAPGARRRWCAAMKRGLRRDPAADSPRTVHVQLAVRARRHDAAARRHDQGRAASRSRQSRAPRGARCRSRGSTSSSATAARFSRWPAPIARRFDFLETVGFTPGFTAVAALPVVGHRVRLRRRGRGTFISLQHLIVMFVDRRRRASCRARSCRSIGGRTGVTRTRDLHVFVGHDRWAPRARAAAQRARPLVAGRLPGRRLAALRGHRRVGARRQLLGLDERDDVAAAAAPRGDGAQRLSGARGHQSAHDHADGLGAGRREPEARARRGRQARGRRAVPRARARRRPLRAHRRTSTSRPATATGSAAGDFWRDVRTAWERVYAERD